MATLAFFGVVVKEGGRFQPGKASPFDTGAKMGYRNVRLDVTSPVVRQGAKATPRPFVYYVTSKLARDFVITFHRPIGT
ncbi:hypothetical protein GHT06_012390 [Daphnia sinensis]|uniref:Uncharacterized protein n=1 Tax=Daphnia sinensis TaxID=1820382 RepID=A0AAD5PX73_9CRUS|nr:hypothetical protein GHT06_012390 [Daphnia sinensis]